MAKYMIHACPKRMWYVEDYLVPSMLAQGIVEDDIIVFNDTKGRGNLYACLDSFASVPDNDGGVWHIQDDILISSDFKEKTEQYDYGIVYGFSGYYDKSPDGKWLPPGVVKPALMWSSFQCVRIPNKVARDFVKWFYQYMEHNYVYKSYVETGKCDDWFFKTYLKSDHKGDDVLNLAPNIAEHIDRLIGGSVINGLREEPEYRARYWEEPELYEELKRKLNG